MEKSRDEIVQELLEIVRSKKAVIEKIEKPEWKTNCVFSIDGKTSNIRTLSSVDKVAELFSSVVAAKNVHDEVNKLLDIDAEFKFGGFSFNDWLNDFKNISDKININAKKAELETYEAKLEKLVSKEKREEMELMELLKSIKG